MYVYYLIKIFDLIDTVSIVVFKTLLVHVLQKLLLLFYFLEVFLILMKKQLSFLHLFHHSSMVFSIWVTTSFFREQIGIFFGFMNTLVHAVMYCYYFLSSFGPVAQKYLSWKKHLTSLQMAQFIVSLAVLVKMKFENCHVTQCFWLLWGFNIICFLGFFCNFYIKAYGRKKKTD
ncbi:unnamed protein product [Nezara viridula]|uniref:Elongation of very long chain fatty acids protein n=1 Tax=Nezara viridula TaxID=85310 RepID=A0A9P0HFZ6_NEZVI|nr:unnamed protein product [Nezara viridula]